MRFSSSSVARHSTGWADGANHTETSYGKDFEAELAASGICLLRPAGKGEAERAGARFFKTLRQIIESVKDTLKGQLDLEAHGGRTIAGVCTRIAQRIQP